MFARRSPSAWSARRRARAWAWAGCLLAGACTSATPSTHPPTLAPHAGEPAPSPSPTPQQEPAAEPVPAPAPRPTPTVHRDTSSKRASYLVELSLRMEDLVLTGPLMQREMAYTFVDGGQFELYVKPSVIPVPNPGCEALIVRMPWTNPEAPAAATAVAGKQQLFARVEDLTHGRSAEVTVVVQLGPYIEVAESDPSRVSLTQCNVFFRHAGEAYAYVDHVGPAGGSP